MPETDKVIEAKQYLTGSNGLKKPSVAIEMLLKSANSGNTEAMVELAHIYKYGIFAKRDIDQSVIWLNKAIKHYNKTAWFYLGSIYKNATDQTRNYEKAYRCFEAGAKNGDLQSIFSQGYMLFKGLGVKQDYTKAFKLFLMSKEEGNSAYFLGLCYRNGYGITADIEKAANWLNLAIQKGNYLAKAELITDPENSNAEAKAIANMYKGTASTTASSNNTYKKIDNVPASFLEGKYEGHIIRYDWSGKHAINSSTLQLELTYINGMLTGSWIEADTIKIPLTAIATPTSLLFRNMEYAKKDHYSPLKALPYQFKNATLNWVKKENETILQGNINMFSLKRNEPEKPISIFLKKATGNNNDTTAINLVHEDGSSILLNNNITAYPNPFKDVVTLNFKLQTKAHVVTKLLTLNGKQLYSNDAGELIPGYYSLPIKPTQNLTAGNYLLVLYYGNFSKTIKIVKP